MSSSFNLGFLIHPHCFTFPYFSEQKVPISKTPKMKVFFHSRNNNKKVFLGQNKNNKKLILKWRYFIKNSKRIEVKHQSGKKFSLLFVNILFFPLLLTINQKIIIFLHTHDAKVLFLFFCFNLFSAKCFSPFFPL